MGAVKIARCTVCGKTYYPTDKWQHIYYSFGQVKGACGPECRRKGQEKADKLHKERRAKR